MKKDTKMCKIKDWESDKADIRARVRNATHVCAKCFRAANDEKHLCRPKKIK